MLSLMRRLKDAQTGASSACKAQGRLLDLLPETPRSRAEACGRKLKGGRPSSTSGSTISQLELSLEGMRSPALEGV